MGFAATFVLAPALAFIFVSGLAAVFTGAAAVAVFARAVVAFAVLAFAVLAFAVVAFAVLLFAVLLFAIFAFAVFAAVVFPFATTAVVALFALGVARTAICAFVVRDLAPGGRPRRRFGLPNSGSSTLAWALAAAVW